MNEHGVAALATGWATVAGERGAIEVRIAKAFPSRLPTLRVSLDGPFAGAPHVGVTGVICYRQDDRTMVDPERPADIIRESVQLALETLRKGRSAQASIEYANEIDAYWRQSFRRPPRFQEPPRYLCLIEPDDEPRLIKAHGQRRVTPTLVDSSEQFAAFSTERRQGGQVHNALYIPIDLPISPGFHPKDLATRAGFVEHVLPILTQDEAWWRSTVSDIRGASVDVVLGVQRTLGPRGLIGVRIETRRTLRNSILLNLEHCTFSAFGVDRGDRGYLLPRGGGNLHLVHKRVLLIGCGSVGGYVAVGLARGGVGKLTLIDPDQFEPANSHRHVCGRAYLGHGKAEGLKRELERLLPYVEVAHQGSNILDVLAREPDVFADYDLVISTTGAPMVDRRINEAIITTRGAPPAILAWLEPYDVGDHVLAINVAGCRRGCYECLHYEDRDGYACQVVFAAPGVEYGRDAMGCGGQFVPFGDLQANRLALRIVERSVELLAGAEGGGLISSKGGARAFRDAGFVTTRRYDEPGTELALSSQQLARPKCPVCDP